MVGTTLHLEAALSWYTLNLTRCMFLTVKKAFDQSLFCCLYVNSQRLIQQCMFFLSSLTIFRQSSNSTDSSPFFASSFVWRFFYTPWWTYLCMFGQIFHYGKMRAYLFWETWNTEMPTFTDPNSFSLILYHKILIGIHDYNCAN